MTGSLGSHPRDLPLLAHAVRQIEVDQLLIGDSGLLCLLLEIFHGLHIKIDGDLTITGGSTTVTGKNVKVGGKYTITEGTFDGTIK